MINWLDIQEALNQPPSEARKVMVAIYTENCALCKQLEETAFQDSLFAAYINEHFTPIKLNALHQEVLEFRDRSFRFVQNGTKGYHELAAELLKGRMSFPSLVFLDEQREHLQSINGLKSTLHLRQIAIYFGDDHYKTTPWSTFKKNFSITDE